MGLETARRYKLANAVKLRLEAGSRLQAGSRLEAGSINSFKYGQAPNNLLTLRLTRLTVELDMSAYSIDAEEDEENEPLIDSDDEGDDDENSADSDD